MDESKIETMHASGEFDAATTALLAAYGREVFGFMRARLRDENGAREAYSLFAVDVWRGMPNFHRRCPFRAWAYAIARNAVRRHAGNEARPARRNVPLDDAQPALADMVRTATAEYLRTEVKSRFAELRDQLSEEEQTILVLRVDKRMEWRDVAAVMIGTEAAQDDLDREAGRLRQSFHQLKKRLKTLARAQGLIRDDES
jgi:RNA polymerase sigma factor (sigma-70 family)